MTVAFYGRFSTFPSNLLLRGLRPKKKIKISTHFWTSPIFSGNCFSIRALMSKLPLNVQITPQKLDFWLEVKKPGVLFSYWLFNRKCIFQDGCRRHLEFRNSISISLLLNQSSPNLMGMLRICHRTQLSYKKCTFTKIQDGGRRHLKNRKSVAISLVLDQCSPNLWESWESDKKRNCFFEMMIFTKVQDAGRRHHLEFWKCVAISILLDQYSPNLKGMLRIWQKTQLFFWNDDIY